MSNKTKKSGTHPRCMLYYALWTAYVSGITEGRDVNNSACIEWLKWRLRDEVAVIWKRREEEEVIEVNGSRKWTYATHIGAYFQANLQRRDLLSIWKCNNSETAEYSIEWDSVWVYKSFLSTFSGIAWKVHGYKVKYNTKLHWVHQMNDKKRKLKCYKEWTTFFYTEDRPRKNAEIADNPKITYSLSCSMI